MSKSAITTVAAAVVLFSLAAFSAYGTETGRAAQENLGKALLTQGTVATGVFAAETQSFRE